MLDGKTMQRETRSRRRAPLGWWLPLLCASTLASGCLAPSESGPSVLLMSMMQALVPGDAPEGGYSCSDIGAGSGMMSGDTTSNLWTSELADGQGVSVEIGSLDQVLAQRYYDRDFIESGRVDQFVVTAANGVEYELIYWGGDQCEPCPPPPYAPPPNNPWGCGPAQAVEPTELR